MEKLPGRVEKNAGAKGALLRRGRGQRVGVGSGKQQNERAMRWKGRSKSIFSVQRPFWAAARVRRKFPAAGRGLRRGGFAGQGIPGYKNASGRLQLQGDWRALRCAGKSCDGVGCQGTEDATNPFAAVGIAPVESELGNDSPSAETAADLLHQLQCLPPLLRCESFLHIDPSLSLSFYYIPLRLQTQYLIILLAIAKIYFIGQVI